MVYSPRLLAVPYSACILADARLDPLADARLDGLLAVHSSARMDACSGFAFTAPFFSLMGMRGCFFCGGSTRSRTRARRHARLDPLAEAPLDVFLAVPYSACILDG
jgi:hypothetical protein